MEIDQKSVLVTGASEGIGLEIARLFASRGARVALAARNKQALGRALSEIRGGGSNAIAISCDVTSTSDVRRMVGEAEAAFGGIDVAINSAGRAIHSSVESLDIEIWKSIVDVNLYGPVRVMQAVAPVMLHGGGGIIVNVSSGSVQKLTPGAAGYASIKAALDHISRVARVELAENNIRVMLIWPSRTATDFSQHAIRLGKKGDPPNNLRTPEVVLDSPFHVAMRILRQIETETPETSMRDPVL